MSYQLPITRELNRSIGMMGKYVLLKQEEYNNLPQTQNHLINAVLTNRVSICSGPLASGKTTAAFIAASLFNKKTLYIIDNTLETIEIAHSIYEKCRIKIRIQIKNIKSPIGTQRSSVEIAPAKDFAALDLKKYDFVILDTADNKLINSVLRIKNSKVLVLTENLLVPDSKDKNGVSVNVEGEEINKIIFIPREGGARNKKPTGNERPKTYKGDFMAKSDNPRGPRNDSPYKKNAWDNESPKSTGFFSNKPKRIVLYDYEDRYKILSKLFQEDRSATIGIYINSKDDFEDISVHLRKTNIKFNHNTEREGINLVFQCTNRKLSFNVSINYKLNTVDEFTNRRGSRVISFLDKTNTNLRKDVVEYFKNIDQPVPKFIDLDVPIPERFDAFSCVGDTAEHEPSSDTDLWG